MPRSHHAPRMWANAPDPQAQLTASAPYLDPRAALLVFVSGLIGLLLTGKPLWLVSEAGITVTVAALSGAGNKLVAALRALLVFLVLVIGASWWEGGLLLTVTAVTRVIALVAWAAAFFEVAPPENVAEALQQWGLPLRIAFIVSAGLRFVPLVAFTYQDLREAQEARGIRLTPFWKYAGAHVALFVPLLREIFRLVDQLAQALEARGFSATPRTPATGASWRISDTLVVFLGCIGCIVPVLFGR